MKLVLLASALLLSLPTVAAETRLHCARLVDVRALQVLTERTVVVVDNKIAAVEAGYTNAPGAEVKDLREHTCLPGLVDLHVHLSFELTPRAFIESFQLNPPDYAVRAVANAQKTLLMGFTSVRDLGGPRGVAVSLRNAVNQGIVPGPRIQAAGFITSTGGHGDPTNGLRSELMGSPGPVEGIVSGPDEARRAVRQQYKEGHDLIKISVTGGVLSLAKSADAPLLADEELAAILATAKDYRFPVAAHAHGAEGMKRAIRAGVQTIEHGTYLDDEAIALMKRHGTWLVPTISAGRFVAEQAKTPGYFPDIIRPKAIAVGSQIQEMFGRAYKAGVKVAFGTDQGVAPHGQNGREFAYMVEAGMPPLEAIRAATLHGATVMGMIDQIGTLEAGKLADVIAVLGDPARDIHAMQAVVFVMKDGRVYKQPALSR